MTRRLFSFAPLVALVLSLAGLPWGQVHAQGTGSGGIQKVLVNPGDQGEASRFATFTRIKLVVEQALRRDKLTATVQMSTDASADLSTTRSRLHDIYVAPAHVIGSAVRWGYVPVLALDKPVQAVLVTLASSPLSSMDQTTGKRLGLPSQDSVVTYLLRGELNAANTTLKRHFSSLYETRYQDALLPCLQLHRCDVVAVERAVFDRWVAAGETVKLVMQTRTVPGLSVAVREGSKLSVDSLRQSLADLAQADGFRTVALTAADFDYVATLGYFTPRSLPGIQVVDAATAARLQQAGGVYIDTRSEAEYRAGHAAGAHWVPYVEKSAKDVDFKASEDSFDLAQLPPDKQAVLVMACNGAECWKSYKASLRAQQAGYARIHWLRGGWPEWRAAGLSTRMGD
jgi:rhodanese-related sulfurtransferase